MKPLSYYQETSVSIPKKDDYMTVYYYRKGTMVGMKVGKMDDDFTPPKNCVEEKVLDEVSYNAHMKHYQEESKRLQDEFREDLIAKYHMDWHPKADKLFDKAWEYGSSSGLWDVEDYFMSLTELFDADDSPTPPNVKERRKVDRRQSHKTDVNPFSIMVK
jgi:hypothetical protein